MSQHTMKCQLALPLLLLWTLTGSNCQITVTTVPDGIRLNCEHKDAYFQDSGGKKSLELPYEDGSSGSYKCMKGDKEEESTIYVKFRTCDNCIDLETSSLAGIIVGDVVATLVIGVAVYLIASHMGPVKAHKTSSDRQNVVPNERSNRAPNDHYQRLRFKAGGQKDEYDVIHSRR